MDDSPHTAAARGGLWRLAGHQPLSPQVDDHGHRPRTERVVHEVAVVEHVPTDAQQLGLTDLTAPGLALATRLNPDRRRHRIVARLAVAALLLPIAFGVCQMVLGLVERH